MFPSFCRVVRIRQQVPYGPLKQVPWRTDPRPSSASGVTAPLSSQQKPPNILIFVNDQEPLFNKCRALLNSLLLPDRYLIYQLSNESVSSAPWAENTAVLIVAALPKSRMVAAKLAEFWTNRPEGDNRNFLHWSPEHPILNRDLFLEATESTSPSALVNASIVSHSFSPDNSNPSVLREVLEKSFGLAVRTNANVDEESATEQSYTSGFLLCEDEGKKRAFIERANLLFSMKKDPSITLTFDDRKEAASAKHLPLASGKVSPSWDIMLYFTKLRSRSLGRMLIYVPVVGSTFDALDAVMPNVLHPGLAVVADRQLKGRGRGGNNWLSPIGCAMFSLQLVVHPDTPLGRRSCFMNQLVPLAIVQAIETLTISSKAVPKIKWPNDIYLGKDTKIGGVLLKSSNTADSVVISVGAGLNLDNAYPTISLNGTITASGDSALSREEYLAEVLNHLEAAIEEFQQPGGQESLTERYLRYWLHSGQQVKLRTAGCDEEVSAVVMGIDDFGYLIVQDEMGVRHTVHPDGNSFDMMRNLIAPKLTR